MKVQDAAKPRKHSRKNWNRRYTLRDMAIIKLDESIRNSQRNRGEIPNTNNRYISVCGCGMEGCFIHGDFVR